MASQTDDEFILQVAETTDASPKQVRDLLKKYHGDHKAVLKAARKIKAES